MWSSSGRRVLQELLSPRAVRGFRGTAAQNTVVVERWWQVPLSKVGRPPRLNPRRHRIYKLVEDKKNLPQGKMELILTDTVPKLGGRGDTVFVKKSVGRNKLLAQGLAVYPSPENKQMFAEELRLLQEGSSDERKQTRTGQLTVAFLQKSKLTIRKTASEEYQITKDVVIRQLSRRLGVVALPHTVNFPFESAKDAGEYWCEITVNGLDTVRLPISVLPYENKAAADATETVANAPTATEAVADVSAAAEAVADGSAAAEAVADVSAAAEAVVDVSAAAEAVADVSAPAEAVADVSAAAEVVADVSAAAEAVTDVSAAAEAVADVSAAAEAVADVTTSMEVTTDVSAATEVVGDVSASVEDVAPGAVADVATAVGAVPAETTATDVSAAAETAGADDSLPTTAASDATAADIAAEEKGDSGPKVVSDASLQAEGVKEAAGKSADEEPAAPAKTAPDTTAPEGKSSEKK